MISFFLLNTYFINTLSAMAVLRNRHLRIFWGHGGSYGLPYKVIQNLYYEACEPPTWYFNILIGPLWPQRLFLLSKFLIS